MFSGGDDGAQAPQDSVAAVGPVMSTGSGAVLPDPLQPTSAPQMDTSTSPEAAELPVVMPPAAAATPENPMTSRGTGIAASTDDDLLGIKQQALQQLSPLIGHLDQPPEERFRTTMMMIQASDNSSLLKTAYEVAQQITEDKERAQALLDVVNEINYFTLQHDDGGSEPAAA